MSKTDENFWLFKLLDLGSKFVHLQDPLAWMNSIAIESGNENHSRRKDFCKAHEMLREYLFEQFDGLL